MKSKKIFILALLTIMIFVAPLTISFADEDEDVPRVRSTCNDNYEN